MSYQIDQSGKIEQTSQNTVISLANSKQKTIILKSKHKRILLKIYQKAGKPKIFSIQVFATLIYILITKSKASDGLILIDKEYPGHENNIRNYILQLASKNPRLSLKSEDIRFVLVGKSSNAHLLGHQSWKKGIADFNITSKEILSYVLNLNR